MISWEKKLEGCFGTDDMKFGLHSSDEEYAKELKKELDDQGITWSVVEKEIKKILSGHQKEHIKKEIKEGKRLLCFGEERR